MKILRHAPVLVLLAVLVACSRPNVSKEADAQPAAPATSVGGIDLEGMDRSIAPGDDFFAFTNGGWAKTTQIPADRSSFGVGSVVNDRARERTRGLVEALAKPGAAQTVDEMRISHYYASYMEEAAIEAKGLEPVKPALAAIEAISDRSGLADWACRNIRTDVDALNATNFYTDHLFGLWISAALDDPTTYVPYLLQGGLGLPDRDYYLDQAPDMAKVRGSYRAHIANILRLAGETTADATAERIMALETKLARVHAARTESADVTNAKPWPRAEFVSRAPGFDWATCFESASLSAVPRFIVWHPTAVAGIAALLSTEPIETWREYLAFHAIDHQASLLPKAFADEQFAFHGTILSGAKEQLPRWKRAIDATNQALGELVGQIYVHQYFPPESKRRLEVMVKNLVAAFDRRIQALDWMDPRTKANARAKLGTLHVGIGYPDTWRDYSHLQVVRGEAYANAEGAERFDYEANLAKLSHPVSRDEWALTPQTVNALNLPILNGLNFPAAILEPPFFDRSASDAANYGSIGAVVGHEISHSFDDQGSQFDASGKLHNWWTQEDFKHFKAASAMLVEQYNNYTALPNLHVNGQLTLSENIADLAGLAAAYDAYRQLGTSQPSAGPNGYTADQEFFISYAQTWRSKMRDALTRQLVMTDGHAPDVFRASTVRNLDPWYDAFGVHEGQRLFLGPPARVRVW